MVVDLITLVLFFAIFAGAMYVYFIPSIIAAKRNHKNFMGIFILNLAGGWTILAWIAALIWAIHKE